MRTAVVGLKMGKAHAEACARLPMYELVAVCDLDRTLVEQTAAGLAAQAAYTDYQQMLNEVRPEAVVIATPTGLHAEMIRMAVAAGVKGVYCEKPIAANMGDVRETRSLCRGKGVRVVIGHQRRVSDPYRTMKRLIDEGEIGDLRRIRATCAGDLLSDGTHLIDSSLYLFSDAEPEWVLGQVYRGPKATAEELKRNPFAYHGVRYGHLIEQGAMAVIGMPGGAHIELMTGGVWQWEEGYQHLELIGSKGRILRSSDGADPAVLIDRGNGWEAVPCDGADGGIDEAHALAAAYFAGDTDGHPMDYEHAFRGFEIMTAIYESARTHARVEWPCNLPDDPLAMMIDNGLME